MSHLNFKWKGPYLLNPPRALLLELSCDSGKQKNREGSDSSPCPPPTCGVVFRSVFTESVRKRCSLRYTTEDPPLSTGLSWEYRGQVEEKVEGKDGEKYRVQRLLPTLKSEVVVNP